MRAALRLCTRRRPEDGVSSELIRFVNQHNEIVAEDFPRRLVDHRNIPLTAKTISEFPLHHGESGFDMRPLVIVLQELRVPERKVMIHLLPRPDHWRTSQNFASRAASAEHYSGLAIRDQAVRIGCDCCDALHGCVAGFALKIPLKLLRYWRKTSIQSTEATRAGAMLAGAKVR
jgi:hypothetical protein